MWGKQGRNSVIATFVENLRERMRYAEYWIGAHPDNPACVLPSLDTLEEFIRDFPDEILGVEGAFKYSSELPFLFKILSIEKPLSIQAHPDRELARLLYASDPQMYTDDNHKLELAVALSEVELLHGFKSKKEIAFFINQRSALRELLGTSSAKLSEENGLEIVYKKLLEVSDEDLEVYASKLLDELKSASNLTREDEWILKTAPLLETIADAGLFSFYFLRLLKLEKFQGIFTNANVPHSYLSGDLAECMTNSNNVIRCGLTDKLIEKEILSEMLEYEEASSEVIDNFKEFTAPTGEFKLNLLSEGRNKLSGSNVKILFSYSGEGTVHFSDALMNFWLGDAYMMPATTGTIDVEVKEGIVFVASCE